MQPEQVLKHTPVALTREQRQYYFENGYVALEGAISDPWIQRLRGAMDEMTEASRRCTESGTVYELEQGHTADAPRLHRLYSPQDHHPVFWEFMASDEMTRLAADVVGPDVKFHHAKLNFKSARGSRGFKWHQDIQAWPHTDYSPVTVGVYIDGCGRDQGPLSMVRGSHEGELYSMYDDSGNFVVRVPEKDIQWLTDDMIDSPVGPPGTAVLLNCRTIHGSLTNDSERARPMLLAVYSSADSFSYTPSPVQSPRLGEIVRGQPARFASFDPRPCELPPDWDRLGYQGPWRLQASEEQRGRKTA